MHEHPGRALIYLFGGLGQSWSERLKLRQEGVPSVDQTTTPIGADPDVYAFIYTRSSSGVPFILAYWSTVITA